MPVISTASKEVKDILDRVERAFNSTERKNAEHRWDTLSKYIIPSQSGLFNTNEMTPGENKMQSIFDITGIQANQDLSSTFHSTLTNPATKWSILEYEDPELNDDDDARTWLEDSNDRMHAAFNESNFDVEVSSNYQQLTALGTNSLQQDGLPLTKQGKFRGFHFKAWHLARVAYEENFLGDVDTIYRKFRYTKRQSLERFGKAVAKQVMESKSEMDEFEYVHIIRPRKDADPEPDQLIVPIPKMPYESLYIDVKHQVIVERGGYMEFPNYVTRFSKMPGEIYGRGPGHIALPDIRTLNKMVELGLTAIAKGVAPPTFSERRNILSSLQLKPNGLTIVQDINKIREQPSNMRADLYQFTKEDYRNSIRQAFLLDKLLLPPREEVGEMTAFEIARRIEQTQRVIGPVFGRLNKDALKPLVLRSFKMMLRGGAFLEPPASVKQRGLNIKVSFVNSLARSQKIEELSAIQQWIQILGPMAQLEQFQTDATDLLEIDNAAEISGRILGVPESAIKDRKVREKDREERKELQRQAAEAQINQTNADAQSKVSSAK